MFTVAAISDRPMRNANPMPDNPIIEMSFCSIVISCCLNRGSDETRSWISPRKSGIPGHIGISVPSSFSFEFVRPSKTPLLTLLKQARAFGVGVVLATQNPVDLDYKGLSNTGTWLIGRLQTERDKARVLDGLEGAAGTAGQGFDRAGLERILSGLSTRVLLMNNVHEDHPVVFESRWVMSYLRGPLTRAQIKTLMDARRGAGGSAPAATLAVTGASAGAARLTHERRFPWVSESV